MNKKINVPLTWEELDKIVIALRITNEAFKGDIRDELEIKMSEYSMKAKLQDNFLNKTSLINREWIPVTKAKPKEGERLMVTLATKSGNITCEGFYKCGKFKFIDYNAFKEFYDPVIAWMSLPEPYKK